MVWTVDATAPDAELVSEALRSPSHWCSPGVESLLSRNSSHASGDRHRYLWPAYAGGSKSGARRALLTQQLRAASYEVRDLSPRGAPFQRLRRSVGDRYQDVDNSAQTAIR